MVLFNVECPDLKEKSIGYDVHCGTQTLNCKKYSFANILPDQEHMLALLKSYILSFMINSYSSW